MVWQCVFHLATSQAVCKLSQCAAVDRTDTSIERIGVIGAGIIDLGQALQTGPSETQTTVMEK